MIEIQDNVSFEIMRIDRIDQVARVLQRMMNIMKYLVLFLIDRQGYGRFFSRSCGVLYATNYGDG